VQFPVNWEAVPPLPAEDFVLIASREHRHDRELLLGILQQPPRYIGLVSSRRKWKLLRNSLQASGLTRDILDHVHAPVGLDIAAQTVPEIAVSILSEMIQVYRKGI